MQDKILAVRELVQIVGQAAEAAGALRVLGVTVRLGARSGFSPEDFRHHFDHEATGTLVEGAELNVLISQDMAGSHIDRALVDYIDVERPDHL